MLLREHAYLELNLHLRVFSLILFSINSFLFALFGCVTEGGKGTMELWDLQNLQNQQKYILQFF